MNVITDFPLVGAAHRSAWLALVLTLLGRSAIAGPVPLFVVEANTRGSGKGLAADAAAIVATGTSLPRKSWTNNDDEIRKTIAAVALEALPAILFDNIVGKLGCGSLDAALTGTTWTDRLLGLSKTTGTLPLTYNEPAGGRGRGTAAGEGVLFFLTALATKDVTVRRAALSLRSGQLRSSRLTTALEGRRTSAFPGRRKQWSRLEKVRAGLT